MVVGRLMQLPKREKRKAREAENGKPRLIPLWFLLGTATHVRATREFTQSAPDKVATTW